MERFPKSVGALMTVGVLGLTIASVAVQKNRTAPEYDHKKPAVDVSKIGVDSQITPGTKHSGLEHAMEHAKVEADVFSSPGGLYTQEDIRKNGSLSPQEKFKGIVSVHDMSPTKGTLICPITKTKANNQFYWWVGGKKYTFCCPPCIEEWVLKAKKGKESLPEPETFLAR